MMATERKPRCSLMSSGGARSAMGYPAGRVADVEIERHQHRRHQDKRLGAAKRPVAARAELLRDQVADHQMGAAAEDQRRDIGAERRDENEEAAGNDPGQSE